jgi:hypothetical protein
MQTYTIGQIYKLGLLKTRDGQPYKDKSTVSITLRRLEVPFKMKKTLHGMSKTYTQEQLEELNNRW